MSKAMEQIVDAYVRLGNRSALEDLRLHHQRLVVDLKGKTEFDFSVLPIGQLEEELAVIEKGLERLHAEGAGTTGGQDGPSSAAPAPIPHQRPSSSHGRASNETGHQLRRPMSA